MPNNDSQIPPNPFEGLYERLFRDSPASAGGLSRNQAGAAFLRNRGLLLDVGCGVGDLFGIIKDRYDEVHGVDIIKDTIDLCIKKGMQAKRVDLNVEDLPYENGKFDSVACFDIIEHVLSPMKLIGEVRRVLKWGGETVIVTPNIRSLWFILRLIFKGKSPKTSSPDILEPYDGGHIHYFTSRDIIKMMTEQGFQRIEVHGWGKVLSRLNWLPTRLLLGKTIDREFFYSGMIIRAEKARE